MFSTVSEALQIVKRYAKIEDESEHDGLLTSLLESSKGKDKITNLDAYRPFIVAGYFLEFNRLNDGIIESTGTDTVKFESSDKTIQGLFNMQKNLDANIINIPSNWNMQTKLKPFSAFTTY